MAEESNTREVTYVWPKPGFTEPVDKGSYYVIPPGIREVHDTWSTFIASMKRFASRIDASISRISTAMSDSIEARLPLSEAIAWALRVCLRNST